MDSSAIDSSLPSTGNAFNASAPQYRAERLTQLSAAQSQETGITIVTAEGDRVTLHSASSSSLGYVAYDARGQRTDSISSVHAEALDFSATSEFSISIEGDLNEQELRDIQKAIHNTEKIFRKLAKGDLDGALGAAGKFEKLDTLSSLDASYSFSRSVSVSEQTSIASSEYPSTSESKDRIPRDKAEDVERAADEAKKALSNSGVDVRKLLKPLNELFAQIFRHSDLDGRRLLHDFRRGVYDRISPPDTSN